MLSNKLIKLITKFTIPVLLFFLCALLTINYIFAQDSTPKTNANVTPINEESAIAKFVGFSAARNIPQLIGLSLRVVLGLMGSIALLLIVWGGFGWLTSGGSPDKIKKAKDTLLWAIIGLIIIFASYALVDILIRTWK